MDRVWIVLANGSGAEEEEEDVRSDWAGSSIFYEALAFNSCSVLLLYYDL